LKHSGPSSVTTRGRAQTADSLTSSFAEAETMPEPKQQLNRRHTEGDGNDGLRAAYWPIAEHAFHLYVEGGCDRSRVAEYWLLAEQTWWDHRAMEPVRRP